MFSFCTDPGTLSDMRWMACYLTTGKHLNFYWAFGTVLLLLAITAPTALAFGFAGASAARSRFLPLSLFGKTYIAIVRGDRKSTRLNSSHVRSSYAVFCLSKDTCRFA